MMLIIAPNVHQFVPVVDIFFIFFLYMLNLYYLFTFQYNLSDITVLHSLSSQLVLNLTLAQSWV
jgi:hypothetical protein